jgi:hypothetical protein
MLLEDEDVVGVTTRALECAEEARVNELLRRSGFDVSLLRDGSEASSAARLGANDAWSEAVYFTLAVPRDWRGARVRECSSQESAGVDQGLLLRQKARALLHDPPTATLSSTEPVSPASRTPRDPLADVTVALARLATRMAEGRVPRDSEELFA